MAEQIVISHAGPLTLFYQGHAETLRVPGGGWFMQSDTFQLGMPVRLVEADAKPAND